MINKDDNTVADEVNQLSLLDAAIYYSKHARVFPLQPGTKIPLLPGSWTNYATQDSLTIATWWKHTPGANIALVADNNFTIVDLDVKDGKDGVASYRKILNDNDIDPQHIKALVNTPSGGKHVFYTHPEGRSHAFHNATNKGEQGGIDIRSGNAYVVAAPSILAGLVNGYSWASQTSDPIIDAVELPLAISDQLDNWSRDNIIDISADQPELLEKPLALNEHPCVNLPEHLQRFALQGDADHYQGDGSAALMGLTSRLYILGMTDQEVLTFLSHYPGPSNVAFKRRQGGSFESAVSWLWKYSCIKGRQNRKMSQGEIGDTFENFGGVTEGSDEIDIKKVQSIGDLSIARDFIRNALTLPPMEQGMELAVLKSHMKSIGVQATLVNKEIKAQEVALRAEAPAISNFSPSFPHITESGGIRVTTQNFKAAMGFHDVRIRHNLMSHDFDILIPGAQWLGDTAGNSQRTALRDLMEQYGMPSGRVDEFIGLVGSEKDNYYHPMEARLRDSKWDGRDRLAGVIDCLVTKKNTNRMKAKLVTTWLVSALKVLGDYGRNPPRGVLVLSGPQSCGKTSFFREIVPSECFGEGLHLDLTNKDSLKRAVKYWIVELGELDATFKKSDIAALKAHISNTTDEIRLPYEAKENKWPRRTVYGATVNKVDFLQDTTGNTRFWPVEVTSVDLDKLKNIMKGNGRDQFWLQIKQLLASAHPHNLTQEELIELENHNDDFREVKLEEEALRNTFDWDRPCTNRMTVAEIATVCGMTVAGNRGRNPFTEPLIYLTKAPRALKMTRGGVSMRCWLMPPLINIQDMTDPLEFLL